MIIMEYQLRVVIICYTKKSKKKTLLSDKFSIFFHPRPPKGENIENQCLIN
jgi:hypothetical protein